MTLKAPSLDEARNLGWLTLSEVLERISREAPPGLTPRTFVLWRSARLFPKAIRPLRGWLDGQRTVLWSPELKWFLEDALRFRSYAHLRGQRHGVGGRNVARSHASVRVLLWVYRWDYPLPLVRRSLVHVVRQAKELIAEKDPSPLDFLRWFFLPSHALGSYRLAQRHRRGRKDDDRDRALKAFKERSGVLTWAEFDLYRELHAAEAAGPMFLKEIARSIRTADERLFDVVRGQAGRLLHALFPPAQQSRSDGSRLLFLTVQPLPDSDDWIAWSALKPVIRHVPKILRYLGLFMAWRIAILHRAAWASALVGPNRISEQEAHGS